MKKLFNTNRAPAPRADSAKDQAIRKRLLNAAALDSQALLESLGTAAGGLDEAAVRRAREEHGTNVFTSGKKASAPKRLLLAFVNPFTAVLLALALISVFTEVVFAAPGDKNYVTVLIITVMVLISGALRFIQETRSGNVAARLSGMLHTTTCVERDCRRGEIPLEEVVVGDVVHLCAGDMIPADLRILTAKDLFISQSALTGESEPVEKTGGPASARDSLTGTPNLAFLGSNVISGTATGVVLAVGGDTMLGVLARQVDAKPPKTTFEKGVSAVSWVLIRFMLVMVPVVLFVNGFTKGDWMQAALFAISVAVGLTPEMLPMIVTTSLAKGAMAMSRRRVIVKNLNSIQNLGSMDILCTDKTGTLTQDRVVLEYHLNVDGEEDDRVLRHAFLNSWFQTGLKNLIDAAVIRRQQELGAGDLTRRYVKVDEIPFDFERRRMSVVVQDETGKTQLVTKGAVEEMLACCAFAECGGRVLPLTDEVRRRVLARSDELNARGMRVIAVAHKTGPAPVDHFSAADEAEMVLIGFLAFLDPPKTTAAAAIAALREYGVAVKVLTGDNEKVTCAICRQVGLDADRILLGEELDGLDDAALTARAREVSVFAKLSPAQKARVVRLLREAGHSVGYMGDGINDAAAMRAADVGISVDTAVDVARETASVVLLEKDLLVLKEGVLEGRRTYANMIKYIKMTASSNFGNMFSVLAASAFLPFLPMESIHLILLNLIYDISCTAMSWDNVDPEFLKQPRRWSAAGISRFMLWLGPTSSVFDIATYLLLYFVICPLFTGGALYGRLADPAARALYVSVFQTGWFVESMWSQTLVIHTLRTPKLPFVQSRASAPVTLLTFAGIALVTAIPFTPLGSALELTALPPVYFAFLAALILGYMALVTAAKRLYVRRWGELL
ncbi:magnesium-translocating P-type ATPase [Candidatus Allofournierella merdavium]|uniref:magnesium-translocating P-type ATPase n=1 Tax=Candidatus Allofournierella merdavium TaxID=2838593 RepID=UPI00374E7ABB